jgi:hypothetical protein
VFVDAMTAPLDRCCLRLKLATSRSGSCEFIDGQWIIGLDLGQRSTEQVERLRAGSDPRDADGEFHVLVCTWTQAPGVRES